MKRAAQYFRTFALGSSLLAALFVALPVKAATFYQQLSDSAGTLVSSSVPFLIGSFTTTATTTITSGVDKGLAIYNFKNLNPGNSLGGGFEISIYSASNCTGLLATYASRDFSLAETNQDVDYFADLLANNSNSFAGGTYYVCFKGFLHNTDTSGELRMNYSNDFFYGYLTSEGTGESIPIAPGIPGFTDVGIATSSQAVYCYQNFASSTGFLDSLGLSISQGFCNVGVFLFVPNSGVLNNFSSLIPIAETKIPFSYFYDIGNIVNGSTASSTQNMTAFSINLAALDFASSTGMGPILPVGNFDFLSSTTISHYLPVGMHDLLYNMMIAAIWVDVAWLFYRKIVPAKAKI